MSGNIVPGPDASLLLLCDHASAHVPADIDLGIAPALLARHIGYDIGAGDLTRALARRLGAPAILGTVSRLVIDLHREDDHPGLIPVESDGHAIPGNREVDRQGRIARFHEPYHRTIAGRIDAHRPALVVAIHSFTRCLEAGGTPRPWHAGILYNRDDRAARLAIAALRDRGVPTGDNEPYSGRLLNATLNRHAEAHGIPSMSVEVRNDLIDHADGVDQWATLLSEVITEVRNGLASAGAPTQ